MIVYVNNILIMSESADVVQNHITATVTILEWLSFIINMMKSVLCPTQQLEFLGLQVSTVNLHLRLPRKKMLICVEALQLL